MRALTEREKLVLCGLICYPDATDREIAEKFKLIPTTVTAIRRRLASSGYFRFLYIPMLNMLGHELLVISYGIFDTATPVKSRDLFFEHTKNQNPKIFAQCRNHEYWLMMGNAVNYTEAKKHIDTVEEFLSMHGVGPLHRTTHVLFPYAVSDIISFFDFTGVAKSLGPSVRVPTPSLKEQGFSEPAYAKEVLTKKELTILYGLVNYPDAPMSTIATKIQASRQCVSKTEKELKARRLVKPVAIPNLSKLNFKYLLAIHIQYKPHTQKTDRERIAAIICDNFPAIMFVSGTFESFIVIPLRTFEDCAWTRKVLSELHFSHDLLRTNPNFMVFPTEQMGCLNPLNFTTCIGAGKI
ncbi:MAG: hypothetical protein ACP5JR_02770 [Thermoplasmata archaeon]